MRDNILISHRGANFEIGRGRGFYGIWAVGAPRTQPLAEWPQTPEGWYGAWARFVAIEAPSTITEVGAAAPAATDRTRTRNYDLTLASGLLAVGVVVGVIGLFPNYLAGLSLANQPSLLVPHVIYFALWTLAALLLALGGTRARVGALLAAGTTVGTLGFFLTDAGTAIASGAHIMGPGLVLGLVGWLLAAGATAAAVAHLHSEHVPAGTGGQRLRGALPYFVAALGLAITFAPAWDSYQLTSTAGATSLTAGNAFANPAPMIAGNVAVMVLIVAAATIAALWRPIVLGAALLIGALVPMIAQAVSAVIQLGEATPSSEFGISAARASAIDLHISSGLTGVFYLYCGFLIVLAVLCAGMLVTIRPRPLSEATATATATATSFEAAPASYEATPASEPFPVGSTERGEGLDA